MTTRVIDKGEQQLTQELNQLQKLYNYLPNEPEPTISILDIFNKTYNENYISDFLAYILNPTQNGIGIGPLQKLTGFGGGKWNTDLENPNIKIEIIREFVLANNRRVDLVILINDSLVIGIENKVFTGEHNKQTIDYAKRLKARFKDYEYVFLLLSPEGKKPLSDAFRAMSYSDLHYLLASISYDAVKDIRKTVIFEDFKTHLEDKFMNQNAFSLSKKAELFIEYGRMLEDLKKSFEEDYKNVLKVILQMIKENLQQVDADDIWEVNTADTRNYHQISKKTWRKSDLFVHFELRMTSSNMTTNGMIDFALDIELDKKKDFITKLEKVYATDLTNLISEKQLDKNIRSFSYVSKKYKLLTKEILQNRDELQKQITGMVDDFLPLIKMIDNTLISK